MLHVCNLFVFAGGPVRVFYTPRTLDDPLARPTRSVQLLVGTPLAPCYRHPRA